MATVESNERWKKENTVFVGLRLMKKTDMDIIEHLGDEERKQPRVKELLRLGIAYEQQGGTAPAPAQAPAPAAPAPDKEFQRLARVGAEYEDMLRRGWRMVEPEKKEEEYPYQKKKEEEKPPEPEEIPGLSTADFKSSIEKFKADMAIARERRSKEYAQLRSAALSEESTVKDRMGFAEWLKKNAIEKRCEGGFDIDDGLVLCPVTKKKRWPSGDVYYDTIDYAAKTREQIEEERRQKELPSTEVRKG